jgi:hypothetical protein
LDKVNVTAVAEGEKLDSVIFLSCGENQLFEKQYTRSEPGDFIFGNIVVGAILATYSL